MILRNVLMGAMGLILGAPSASESAPARHYSGAEWVLDSEGRTLATTPVFLERIAELNHGSHERHLRRLATNAVLAALDLSPYERTVATVIGVQPAPWTLEARDMTETLRGGMLALRVVERDGKGSVRRIHIVNATPIDDEEYAQLSGAPLAD